VNQRQSGGHVSFNIQGHEVHLHGELSVQDLRDIALDLFKANFYELADLHEILLPLEQRRLRTDS
jgi:hypothetical protein